MHIQHLGGWQRASSKCPAVYASVTSKFGAAWGRWGANRRRAGTGWRNWRRCTSFVSQLSPPFASLPLCTAFLPWLRTKASLLFASVIGISKLMMTCSNLNTCARALAKWARVLLLDSLYSKQHFGLCGLLVWWGDPDLHPQGDVVVVFLAHWKSLLGMTVKRYPVIYIDTLHSTWFSTSSLVPDACQLQSQSPEPILSLPLGHWPRTENSQVVVIAST